MSSHLLTCRTDEAPFAHIVRPAGEVDLSTAPILRRALAAAIASGRHVVVDLTDVTFIDSTGFRELLAHRRVCRENDRLLVLVNPRKPVQSVIDTLNFYQIIPVYPTLDAAEMSFKAASRPAAR